MNDLELDLSRSAGINSEGGVELPLDNFLLVFSSNIYSSPAPLRGSYLHNLSDLDFDLSSYYGVALRAIFSSA